MQFLLIHFAATFPLLSTRHSEPRATAEKPSHRHLAVIFSGYLADEKGREVFPARTQMVSDDTEKE